MVGMADDLLLTLLTMLMVVILCLRRATNVVFMSTAVILANIVGFGLGKGIAALFDLTALPDMAVNPLSTFLCTQAVGFLVEFSARRPGTPVPAGCTRSQRGRAAPRAPLRAPPHRP